jgi:hypothetical protein
MIDIEDIRKNYQNFLDEKIIDLARNSSKGLRKESDSNFERRDNKKES